MRNEASPLSDLGSRFVTGEGTAGGHDDAGRQLMSDDPEPGMAGRDPALTDTAIDWLVLLHSGRARPVDHVAFAAWRRRSPAHEEAAQTAEALWWDVAATDAAEAHRRRSAAVAPDRRTASPRLPARRALLAGTAAAAVAAVVAGTLPRPYSRLFADHATEVGERRDLRLPDGSRALLDTATALDVDFSGQARRLTLHGGQVLIEVEPDRHRPLVVSAGPLEASAVGTAFAAGYEAGRARVVVSNGVVEVRGQQAGPVRVGRGQTVTADADSRSLRPVSADLEAMLAWTRGELVFNRRPLAEVAAELERYRRGRIAVLGERLQALKVSGVFGLDDPDAALQALEATLGVDVLRLPLLAVIRDRAA